MKVTIERFDGDSAVVETEDREFVAMPRSLVPPGARVGSILTIALVSRETKQHSDNTAVLIEELWK